MVESMGAGRDSQVFLPCVEWVTWAERFDPEGGLGEWFVEYAVYTFFAVSPCVKIIFLYSLPPRGTLAPPCLWLRTTHYQTNGVHLVRREHRLARIRLPQ